MTQASTSSTEVAQLLHELIRIDTSNPGGKERPAAEWVAGKLDEVGIDSILIEAAPGRTSLVARIQGTGSVRPPLLVHGHLDVVPALADEWSVPPFSGEVVDGQVWGRGAVDMKNMNAMVLTVVREWARTGRRPSRDLVLAFVADEETGGQFGSRYLVERHSDLIADCTEAIGEVGGFSLTLNESTRLYMIQTAEKGLTWLRLRSTGRPSHGSLVHRDNAITRLAAAVSRIGEYEFPTRIGPEVRALLAALEPVVGRNLDPQKADEWLPMLGAMVGMIGASLRNTANPTRLQAGLSTNVIPSSAEAWIDARFLPGEEQHLLEKLHELAGEGIEIESMVWGAAVGTSFDGRLVEQMCQELQREDPGAVPVPYLLTSGTDAKAFHTLGIRCFGFVPLRLPAGFEFASMFHGIDERVPIEALEFGVRVLDGFLADC